MSSFENLNEVWHDVGGNFCYLVLGIEELDKKFRKFDFGWGENGKYNYFNLDAKSSFIEILFNKFDSDFSRFQITH